MGNQSSSVAKMAAVALHTAVRGAVGSEMAELVLREDADIIRHASDKRVAIEIESHKVLKLPQFTRHGPADFVPFQAQLPERFDSAKIFGHRPVQLVVMQSQLNQRERSAR
eukprot:CAMPEP_0197459808 /NCGR_PEP_ID=MMETSP1175-20131217/52434_1 /TAXON_ID=1003142 /ORGANISM="Triceratium dubium, Strain CCMP147" /LENGTH=110 /DNA_ID=CAMNT_0042994777 /DNA_START=274 /DNA_END=606 /DNA_ORIENTATION=+